MWSWKTTCACCRWIALGNWDLSLQKINKLKKRKRCTTMHDNKCNAATMLLPPLNVLKFMAIIKIHFHRAARLLLAPTTGRITESRHIKCCFLTCECVCGVCACVCHATLFNIKYERKWHCGSSFYPAAYLPKAPATHQREPMTGGAYENRRQIKSMATNVVQAKLL